MELAGNSRGYKRKIISDEDNHTDVQITVHVPIAFALCLEDGMVQTNVEDRLESQKQSLLTASPSG
jgi:hypothetical protein